MDTATNARSGAAKSPQPGVWDISDMERQRRISDAMLKTIRKQVTDDIRADRIKPPLLPSVATDLMTLTSNAEFEIPEVVGVIEHDQFITASLLKVANSAYYGRRAEVTNLQAAVMRMGVSNVRDLVFAIAFRSTILREEKYRLLMTTLWEHALTTASVTRKIIEFRSLDASHAFLAGLLHDIGKPTLVLSLMGIAKELEKRKQITFEPQDYVPEMFEAFHVAVGGLIGARWNLPQVMRQAIEQHHEPDLDNDPTGTVRAVYLADRLTNAVCGPNPEQCIEQIEQEGVLERLDLGPLNLERLVAEVEKAREEALAAFA